MPKRDSTGREMETITKDDVGTIPAELLESDGSLKGTVDPKTFSVPAVENPYEDDFNLFTSGFFLPRLQLEGGSSKSVKKKLINAGHYAIITGRDQLQDMGEQLDLLVLTYRSKALDMSDPKNIVASFEPGSEEFKRIQGIAQQKSKGYLYGLEFLCFIPDYDGDVKFVTFFMGNPTMRVEAKNMKPLLQKNGGNGHVTLKVDMLDNGEHMWEAPVIIPCSSPLREYPTQEEMTAQMKLFVNPPKGPIRQEVPDDAAAAAGVAGEGARER